MEEAEIKDTIIIAHLRELKITLFQAQVENTFFGCISAFALSLWVVFEHYYQLTEERLTIRLHFAPSKYLPLSRNILRSLQRLTLYRSLKFIEKRTLILKIAIMTYILIVLKHKKEENSPK